MINNLFRELLWNAISKKTEAYATVVTNPVPEKGFVVNVSGITSETESYRHVVSPMMLKKPTIGPLSVLRRW